MIKEGAVYAVKKRREVYARQEPVKRKRGTGKRKGASKARQGSNWQRKVRSQRALLKKLKVMEKIDGADIQEVLPARKGNAFAGQEIASAAPRGRRA